MALVEVVAPALADPAVVARAVAIVERLGQDPGGVRRPARLHRQPGQPAVHHRGTPHPRGRRRARHRDRRGAPRGRLPDGSVRADGPDRDRRQPRGRDRDLGRPRAARAAAPVADPGAARRSRRPRPQDGRRVLPIRRREPDRRGGATADVEPRRAPRADGHPRPDRGGHRRGGAARGRGRSGAAGHDRPRAAPGRRPPARARSSLGSGRDGLGFTDRTAWPPGGGGRSSRIPSAA